MPQIVSIPGTTKLAHLQEKSWHSQFWIHCRQLKSFNKTVSKIKIVDERYPACWHNKQIRNQNVIITAAGGSLIKDLFISLLHLPKMENKSCSYYHSIPLIITAPPCPATNRKLSNRLKHHRVLTDLKRTGMGVSPAIIGLVVGAKVLGCSNTRYY